VHLKYRLGDVQSDRRNCTYGSLLHPLPQHAATIGEEPSTASRADINRCTNRHRTAETFGQILSWLLETVRLRSAPELAVGARAEN
jgi:hypothetical protein